MAGVNIVTNASYDTFGQREKDLFADSFGGAVFGQASQAFFVPQKTSVGYRILQNLREDQDFRLKHDAEVAKKRAAGPVAFPEESFTDLADIQRDKDEFFGLGFDPSNKGSPASAAAAMSLEDEVEAEFNRRIKRLMNIHEEVRSTGLPAQNRIAFGQVGEDDLEVCTPALSKHRPLVRGHRREPGCGRPARGRREDQQHGHPGELQAARPEDA